MFIVMGGTGHVGSATAKTLLEHGHRVTIVTRQADHADEMHALGAEIAVADLHDVDAMREIFRSGKRLFLLNPPADPSTDTDTDAVERQTIGLLLDAINGSGLEMIVAESTYGAQPGSQIGDLNTLFELEQGLQAQPVPHAIIRAAYYMSNWDMALSSAQNEGVVPTMYPADFELPMVAPRDLGKVAADLLITAKKGVFYVEGPERCSSNDVARAFEKALGRPVKPQVTPRDQWEDAFSALGFSEQAARSYARMTALTADSDFQTSTPALRGSTSLEQYIAEMVQKSAQALG